MKNPLILLLATSTLVHGQVVAIWAGADSSGIDSIAPVPALEAYVTESQSLAVTA